MGICVKRLEINILEMREVFDLLPMLYATESSVLWVTPLHDSGEEKKNRYWIAQKVKEK